MYLVRQNKNSIELFVDGCSIATCSSLPVAITLYSVAFYVFNLHFCKNSAKTVLFLQRYALCINDKPADKFLLRCFRATATVMEKLAANVTGNVDKASSATVEPDTCDSVLGATASQAPPQETVHCLEELADNRRPVNVAGNVDKASSATAEYDTCDSVLGAAASKAPPKKPRRCLDKIADRRRPGNVDKVSCATVESDACDRVPGASASKAPPKKMKRSSATKSDSAFIFYK